MCKKSLLGITYSGKGVLGGLDGLGDGTDLVDLEQQGVARLELDSLLDELGVRDGQIVAVYGEQESTKDETITYPTIWKSEVL
jgi:hypothetical protein